MGEALDFELCAAVSAMLKRGLKPRGVVFDAKTESYRPVSNVDGMYATGHIHLVTQVGLLQLYLPSSRMRS